MLAYTADTLIHRLQILERVRVCRDKYNLPEKKKSNN